MALSRLKKERVHLYIRILFTGEAVKDRILHTFVNKRTIFCGT